MSLDLQTTKYSLPAIFKLMGTQHTGVPVIKHLLLVAILWCAGINNTLFAQTTGAHPSARQLKADNLFDHLRYIQAIDAYKTVLVKEPENIMALENLATCYRKLNDYPNAEKIYAKAVGIDTLNATVHLYYAQCLSANQKYQQARLTYTRYAVLNPGDKRGTAFAYAYSNMRRFYCDSSSMTIELLNINSGQSDFSPAYFKKGLVFCSNRNEGRMVKRVFEWNQSAFLDLYYVQDTAAIGVVKEPVGTGFYSPHKKQHTNDDDTHATPNDNGTLGYMNLNYKDTGGMFMQPDVIVPRFSKSLSSKYHEGPLVFFSNGDSLIFTRNNYDNGKYNEGDDGINKLKLYSATCTQNDSNWQNIKSLPFNDDNYATGHPALAPGDTILYFVSDKPGGQGGSDIYRSFYRNGHWSAGENIGAPVNTAGNEVFPFIGNNNLLYFASDGHAGLGGLDIFKTSLSKQGIVENMGYPVNTSFDDFGLIINPETKTGFFSSNRRRGLGDDDIYRVQFNDLFYVRVIDGITKTTIIPSTLEVSDVVFHSALLTDSVEPGIFKADVKNHIRYEISGSATGYASNTLFVTADVAHPVITLSLYKPDCIVGGTITDKDSKLPVEGARIIIYDKTATDTVYDNTVDYNGKYRYVNLKPNHQYSLTVSREGYFNKPPRLLHTKKSACGGAEYDYAENFELERIVIGRAIKIDNIYFDVGKSAIRPKSAKELDKIVKMMQENPNIIIELSSHTDCRSSAQYNLTLSDNRAKASANYIISKGISAERISGKGYGETKLVNDCACEGKVMTRKCTEAEHQANRRTEFQVTGFIIGTNNTIEKIE
jgi:outer membrane protein OmpA-like peptidoglycan-associated protein/tetratricopeptide (TPR) repeat protein